MRLISIKGLINAFKQIVSVLEREYESQTKEKIEKYDFKDINKNSD